MDEILLALLHETVRRGASDLHVSSDGVARIRCGGTLAPASGEVLSRADVERMLGTLLSEPQQDKLRAQGGVDVSFALEETARFRGHVFQEQRGPALAARRLEERFRPLSELGLPAALADLARLRDGLVLFTGPTGSGKSTTLATLLDQINRESACHIVTIEDPIEYVHVDRLALVRQREVLRDVPSFAEAVRASLREDPDVLLVGEMRDVETMRAAITVAETGHLVFSTLHCGSVTGALDRLIGAFDANERESLCQQLSMTLRAVVAQHLLPRADGQGRVPAVEILRVTGGVANLIRSHKSEQIRSALESGGEQGMLTLEASLASLVREGRIGIETARSTAGNVRLLEQHLLTRAAIGQQRGTTR